MLDQLATNCVIIGCWEARTAAAAPRWIWSGARSSLTLSLMIRLCFHDPPKSSRSVSDDGGGGAVHVVMLLKHMIRIRILEIRKGRRVSRPEGLASGY